MYLEDYAPGSVFSLDPVSVTQQDIIEFALSYDQQPFHTDPVAAADGPFGGIIASGWQTCALTMRALVAGYFSPLSSLGSPGIDEIRWPAPVRGDDVLTVNVTVLENRPSSSKPDRGIIRSHIQTMNQNGVVVLTMTAINVIRTRA
ncbi:MAG: MaoC family dehydratase [Actinomycetota bacterium]|nr:MaoC family dehydratase [Actinomycetota bacterium]